MSANLAISHWRIEGRGVVTFSIDLDEVNRITQTAMTVLEAAGFERVGAASIGSQGHRKYFNGFGVWSSKDGWVQIRRFSKSGSEISAAKYQDALTAAGIVTTLSDGRLTAEVPRVEVVA
jgi:hypothetical protein